VFKLVKKKSLILIFLTSSFICFCQYNSFYLATNVNNTFCRVTQKDNFNKTNALIGPGFNLALGYSKQLNQKFTVDFSLNFLLRNYIFSYDNNGGSSQYGTLNPVPQIQLKYLKKLNLKNSLCYILSYNQLLTRNEGSNSAKGINLNTKDTTYSIKTNFNGFAPCLGLGIGSLHKLKNRYCYYGITYFYGLSSYSITKIEVYKNNTTYYSEVASRLSYLSFDFKIYFKKHKEIINKID